MVCLLPGVMSACQSTNLKRRWLDLFSIIIIFQYVCNHSTSFVVFFFFLLSFNLRHFWHIQSFIANLETMPLNGRYAIATYLNNILHPLFQYCLFFIMVFLMGTRSTICRYLVIREI
jgi:hypothetical protein